MYFWEIFCFKSIKTLFSFFVVSISTPTGDEGGGGEGGGGEFSKAIAMQTVSNSPSLSLA